MIRIFCTALVLFTLHIFTPICTSADEISPFLIQVGDDENCQHGLHPQPGFGEYKNPNGPFAVYLFCDMGLGTNIGVILIEPGAGGGKIGFQPKSQWQVNKRFWQDPLWATDVTSFAWCPSGKYLYVATSMTYGDGQLFKLDLLYKSIEPVILKGQKGYDFRKYEGYSMIDGIDLKKNILKVSLYLLGADEKKVFLRDEIKLEKSPNMKPNSINNQKIYFYQ